MKTTWFCRFALILIVMAGLAERAGATVFTTNTDIGLLNTNYDGQDIVISNCTVTVDGPHTFSSLTVATNGILTHSFSQSGELYVPVEVTNLSLVLNGINPVRFGSNAFSVLVTDPTQSIIYSNGVDYLVFTETNSFTYIERTTNSTIPDGGTVLVNDSYYAGIASSVGLDLTVTGMVWVVNGGEIEADGTGYGGGAGPGAGASSTQGFFDGSGGGDGGSGGMSSSNALGGICYDSLYEPGLLGSGGGSSYAGAGGNGGGLVQITAGGNVEIDGIITANGQNATNSRAGGGSGGGIWISAPSVSGAGSISANGGAGAPGYGGGGGGGRVAIACGTNNFAGTITAYGGSGANYGGAGTVFIQVTGQIGMLTLDNGGNIGTNSTVMLSNMANVAISDGAILAASGTLSASNVLIGTNGVLTFLSPTQFQYIANLSIGPGGFMSAYVPGSYNGTGNGRIYTTGGITYGGGAGYGGNGGAASVTNATGGINYGSEPNPSAQGSYGGGSNGSLGGAGGGAIELNVSGTLLDNGTITASGGNGSGLSGGGGSGGSLYLVAGTLSGDGSITANGGAGTSLGGGGGGGRISIDVEQTNNFTGPITCYGGGGANYGGAGTVVVALNGGGALERLIVDNGGNTGPPTALQSLSAANLVIQNGGWALNPGGSWSTLTVASNSWLTFSPSDVSSTVTILTTATIQVGGGITLNSDGYPANSGQTGNAGDSFNPPYGGGGGGNGGFGGYAISNSAAGGPAGYNSVSAPQYAGGGGGGYSTYSIGGFGGGGLQLRVDGTLQLNGTISANGGNGSGAGGGGGAGGSLAISAGTLSGSGSISANGGTGANAIGGGGGGGCIAVTFNTNSYLGTFSAFGGAGANAGGAGTIYFKTNSAINAELVVDNGGQLGAGSAANSSSAYTDLTLRNDGLLITSSSSSATYANVLITNASILVTNGTFTMTANNVTLQNGGGIIANAGGYSGGSGPDLGSSSSVSPYYPCGGGGNGGAGGAGGIANSNSAAGGGGYGNYTAPAQAGSGGGNFLPYSYGGAGGGVIALNVSGTLAVNGTISANGANGSGNGGGGGAGGSLNLTIGNLTGAGVITANGGAGANRIGGGGGGGIIGINFQSTISSNVFLGTISAYGGLGWTNGGAGTILIKTNGPNTGVLIVDNAGNVGTNTLLSNEASSGYSLQVRNGAIAGFPSPEGFMNILVTSNAWIEPAQSQDGLVLDISGTATINAGGGIIADSFGSPQNSGSGSGRSFSQAPYYPCSGGGHGGDGAFSLSNSVPGGSVNDSLPNPSTYGSGGGGFTPYSPGGSGGGYIELYLTTGGPLQLNGVLSANGGNGSGLGGGGGGGGGIEINAGVVSGTGTITANGGNGALAGGGGGGGLISIVYSKFAPTNLFAGTISAHGGGGANYGGAGMIYDKTNTQNAALLLLDNAGNVGTNTPISLSGVNVTVQNGAIGVIPGGVWNPDNVFVLTNSALTVQSSSSTEYTVNAVNLTIAGGGAFSIDGKGFSAQAGTGAGALSGGISGGGSHGGYGGGDPSGSGAAYDSIQLPALTGSGGANSSLGASGGWGGGNVIIEVLTNLVVNGRLSANGMTGGLNAGGGAGGSIYLENIPNLSGSGVILANGGAASGSGGGGGGGRIAVSCTSNNFTGQFSASGGAGNYPGGAGTIYTKIGSAQTLVVNNGGIVGTNTPLSSALALPSSPFELDISGGALVVPLTPLPLLSNLNVSAASTLTMPVALSNLFVGVMGNASIGGSLDVDDLGYSQSGGPGGGTSQASEGSGAGYGGAGGASGSGASGGVTYGSATAPTDFGSGGGNGADTTGGGSVGGGALRLSVLGTLNVNGNISANGDSGLQDDSGGGSGGSVWISAGTLSGSGTISAAGGYGVLYGGGGGGGGRIAIYAPTNQFTGTTNVSGGLGSTSGQAGTLSLSSALSGMQVVSQSPNGYVTNTVSSVLLTFSDMLNPSSVSSGNFQLYTPAGTLNPGPTATVVSPFSVQLNFPTQNLVGLYTLQTVGAISDMAGTLLTPYTGAFVISIPTISGTVTGTNGAGVAGVSMQPSGGLPASFTGSDGSYYVGVPPGWTGTVTPSAGSDVFLPPSMSYTNVTASVTNQNYTMVLTIAPSLTTSFSTGNFSLNWNGISGVTYQVLWSTNLVTWQPYGGPLAGTNGSMQIVVPSGSNSTEFFQIQAGD